MNALLANRAVASRALKSHIPVSRLTRTWLQTAGDMKTGGLTLNAKWPRILGSARFLGAHLCVADSHLSSPELERLQSSQFNRCNIAVTATGFVHSLIRQ